jgi:hypothetical protein
MAKMLLREMSYQEQMNLWGLTKHPGFDVLVALMDEAVRDTAADPIRLDPMADKYEEKLAKLALIARATNDFCMSVRNAVNTHIVAAAAKQKQEEQEAKMDEEAEKLQSTIRLLDTQDNEE